jgi:hypothetical protein
MAPVERRRELLRIDRELRGKRVAVTIANNRGLEDVTQRIGVLLCCAVPQVGTVSDLVIVERDGYMPDAWSASIVVSIEAV